MNNVHEQKIIELILGLGTFCFLVCALLFWLYKSEKMNSDSDCDKCLKREREDALKPKWE